MKKIIKHKLSISKLTNYKLIENCELKIVNSHKVGGFSLIEMLVAVAVFATIAVVTTQSLGTTLKNSRKSDAIRRTRQNVDYALSTMERLLRNSQQISCPNPQTLNYVDEYGTSTSFNCNSSGQYIASGSARLTTEESTLVCNSEPVFLCTPATNGTPASVQITLNAYDSQFGNTEEGASVRSRTKVQLRNYLIY